MAAASVSSEECAVNFVRGKSLKVHIVVNLCTVFTGNGFQFCNQVDNLRQRKMFVWYCGSSPGSVVNPQPFHLQMAGGRLC